MSEEIGNLEELLCPMCLTEIADRDVNPDWRSDTTIRCCSDCGDILNQAKRYDYYHNMPKKFYGQHIEKLNRALDELHREYVRLYGKK